MSERIWSDDALEWGYSDPDSGEWVRDDPPQPAWAAVPEGLAARFVRAWRNSDSVSAVRKIFFWTSMAELLAHHRSINAFLVEQGYAPLQLLPLRSGEPIPELPPILSASELAELASEGTIQTLTQNLDTPEDSPEDVPVEEVSVEEVSASAGEDDEELDLTPTPPRPDEDPYRGVSPLSLAIPGYGRNDPLSEYYSSFGDNKMRIRIKH